MAYLNESHIEDAHVTLFEELGFRHSNAWKHQLLGRDSLKEVVFKQQLHTALTSLNSHLPENAIQDALYELTKSRLSLNEIEANQEVYELIKEGVPVSFTNDKGVEEQSKAKVIDFEEVTSNSYEVISQLSIQHLHSNATRRPDLILYVNGLPLVMVELKNATVKLKTAYDDNLQKYRRDIPQLFYYNLFVLVSNGIQTRIGAFNAPWEHFFTWIKEQDNSQNPRQMNLKTIEALSQNEQPKLSLVVATHGLCRPINLLDYCENFVLYSKKRVKIIAKNHQFLGVNASVDAIAKRNGKVGTFWHTQGSGKSYSMIFFSKKVKRKLRGDWSFLIVTDRSDLDDQLFKNFLHTETFKLAKSESNHKNPFRAKGKSSKKQLAQALQHNKSYFFTTIFNFGLDKGKRYTQKSDKADWVVIVDEAHRTQYKSLGDNLRIALPNAQYIAFTGTPILKNSQTQAWFGDYVSEYNFAQSIEDGATVPLYYQKSVPRVQNINENLLDEASEIIEAYELSEKAKHKLDREYSNLVAVVEREDRLDEVAKDIVKHFPKRLNVKDEEGNPRPMKAMVVSINKFTAVKMFDKVQKFVKERIRELRLEQSKEPNVKKKQKIQEEIAFLQSTKMSVVISQEGSLKEECEKFDAKGLNLRPYRKLMDHPDEDGRDIEDYFKDPNNPYRIVFVTAMWMTGFDAPSVSTLYLDKPMKNHTLMQTIARTNRVFEAKKNGLIVDYFGVFRNLKKALSDYGEGSYGSPDEVMPVQEIEALIALLEEAIAKTKTFLLDLDVEIEPILALRERVFREIELFEDFANKILVNDEVRKAFNLHVNTVTSLYDSAKPKVFEFPHLQKARDLLLYLKELLNRQLEQDESLKQAQEALDDLLDSSVIREGDLAEGTVSIEPYKKINLAKLDFEKLREEFPKKEHQNIALSNLKELMEHKLKQMMAQNRTRGQFMEKFEQIMDEYNNDSMLIEDKYERLLGLSEAMQEEESRAMREGLSEEQLEIFDLLKKEKLTQTEKSEVKKASVELLKRLEERREELFVEPWYREKQKREIVESEIREVLDSTLPLSYDKELFSLANQKVVNHISTLAQQRDVRYLCA